MISQDWSVWDYLPKWFYPRWWAYLFRRPRSAREVSWALLLLCRWRGHPAGPIYFNPHGLEPDMHCRLCGEDIG